MDIKKECYQYQRLVVHSESHASLAQWVLKSREQRYTKTTNDDNNVLFSCYPKNKSNTVLEVYFTLGIAGTVTGQKYAPFVIKLRG